MGNPHMGIFESPCPFWHGNQHMETVIPVWKTFPYGDFYLNPQMGTDSIGNGLVTEPSPFGNGDLFQLLPNTKWGLMGIPISIWGCPLVPHIWNHGKISIPQQKNGEDALQRVTQRLAKTTVTISIRGVTIRKQAGSLRYSHLGNHHYQIEFVSIWGLTYTPNILASITSFQIYKK